MSKPFPKGFTFGAATASYQIEGGANEGNRGLSIWDTFSHTPGKVFQGHTGDLACDHFHRYNEDFDYLQQLNVQAYRMSIAWPRIFPEGKGAPNPLGLAFYDRLFDSLLERHIEPWVTLYHWDLPQSLQDLGGWCNRDIQYWFRDYAVTIASHFGDRVKHFAMINEPNVTAWLGYGEGVHAPGLKNLNAMFAATHHQNLAQGRALATLRSLHSDLVLGCAPTFTPAIPAQPDTAHENAAHWYDNCWNRNFFDPLLLGTYPEETRPYLEEFIRESDMQLIHQKIDFLGVNYYCKARVAPDDNSAVRVKLVEAENTPLTDMGWAIEPEAFYEQLIEFKTRYNNPRIYITENGCACPDDQATIVGANTYVHDKDRIHFFYGYLEAMLRAINEGVNVQGYFAWSLMDNFEWACGYEKRFGLLHVNYETLQRTPKDSFRYLSKVMGSGTLIAPPEIHYDKGCDS